MDITYTFPTWFTEFLEFYVRPERPTIKQALTQYAESLPDPSHAPKYWQVRRVLKSYRTMMQGAV